ncbi:MAG: hypothetical protein E7438_03710 [Ruminococcaceae bacterium]|nr:hypothetical protein [Oscillospiraceae bacterium]
MKKRMIWIILLIVLLILLIPIPRQYNDGGTTEYKAVLYSVYDVHRINPAYFDNEAEPEYINGIIIEILGKEVYNNTKPHLEL